MASRPVVLCYSSFTSPVPAFDLLFELAPAYEGDFTLLDEVAVTDLSEDERAKIEGILVSTGAINRTHRKVGKEIINLLPNLKVISTPSTGINHIDVQAATDRGIRVGRSPGHFTSDSSLSPNLLSDCYWRLRGRLCWLMRSLERLFSHQAK